MSELTVGSLFAGIGGFDLGFERAGFRVAWCVEWDKDAQAVLRKRFPHAKVHGDIRELDHADLESVNVVCGGFPCQDLSSAGKRAGLSGERSGLFHEAMRIVRGLRPDVLILENVIGLLTSNNGHDFATVLREVAEGWPCEEVAWRVLDSQHFGVPQRRRRVFVVSSASAGCAESILALPESGCGDSPTRGKKRKADPRRTPSGVGGPVPLFADLYNQVITGDISPTVTSATGISNASGPKVISFKTGNSAKARSDGLSVGVSPTLGSDAGGNTVPAVAVEAPEGEMGERVPMIIRRIMPVEAERLQGFPDGWTQIGTEERPTPDGRRYRQLGNAVTVNVAEWIARRAADALKENAR